MQNTFFEKQVRNSLANSQKYAEIHKAYKICLYHMSDMDGFGSCAVLDSYLNFDETYKYTYGKDVNFENLPENKHKMLYIVDVCITSESVLIELSKEFDQIIIIDHHSTSLLLVQNFNLERLHCAFVYYYGTYPAVYLCAKYLEEYFDFKFQDNSRIMIANLAKFDVDLSDEKLATLEQYVGPDYKFSRTDMLNAEYYARALTKYVKPNELTKCLKLNWPIKQDIAMATMSTYNMVASHIIEKYRIWNFKLGPLLKAISKKEIILVNVPNYDCGSFFGSLKEQYDVCISFVFQDGYWVANMFSDKVNLLETIKTANGHPGEASVSAISLKDLFIFDNF